MTELEAFKEILESTARFYRGDKKIQIFFRDNDTAYCSKDYEVVLPPKLLNLFKQNRLPRFSLYYHELGHALYSESTFNMVDKWKAITKSLQGLNVKAPVPPYDSKYLYLNNWIEDFYIENKLKTKYSYLSDIIRCLHLVPLKHDLTTIDKSFHYYYVKNKIPPKLSKNDGTIFVSYINRLLALRNTDDFNKAIVNLLNANSAVDYIKELVQFYNWCVLKGILQDIKQPPLQTPIHINVPSPSPNAGNADGPGSSVTDHTHLVGSTKMIQTFPEIDLDNPIFNSELDTENNLIQRYLTSYRVDSSYKTDNMNGLFSTTYQDTAVLAKPNIKSFFNPNRIADRILFLYPEKHYNNVAIYRDISGSTHRSCFKQINDICKYLISNIPIDVHYYLYSSGDVSIHEVEFKDWSEYSHKPEEYKNDPVFQQMGGGTNSDAIADVISQQYDDKYLNIIVTDGDLYSLFSRDNIEALLNNVAIVNVDSNIGDHKYINPNHFIYLDKDDDNYDKISTMLNNFKETT